MPGELDGELPGELDGELDGHGQLPATFSPATFSNMLSSGKRCMAFEDQITLNHDEWCQTLKALLLKALLLKALPDKQIERLKLYAHQRPPICDTSKRAYVSYYCQSTLLMIILNQNV